MATEVLSGELFAGVGGLGMAVDSVFGTRPGFFSEHEPPSKKNPRPSQAAARVLAHRYPDVPNLGDVSRVVWSTAPRVRVLSGGFPCQDVSIGGGRRGLKDGTRSGLWSEFARAIDELRPDWVVIENVGGLLSAGADSDVEPCPWCLGDDPNRHALRALGAVLADLAALGFDAEWTGVRAAHIGAPHGRLRIFILAWPSERTGSGARTEPAAHLGRGLLADDVELLPTPAAMNPNDGESAETWLARREVVKARGINGNGMGMPLAIAVQFLPTPGAYDGGIAAQAAIDWGRYSAAVERWERILGRPAPAPVRVDRVGGKERLNPELTEWMMGWPLGWVTDPAIGISRKDQLRACGNGVVPQQAEWALRSLLARAGVPAIDWGLAA